MTASSELPIYFYAGAYYALIYVGGAHNLRVSLSAQCGPDRMLTPTIPAKEINSSSKPGSSRTTGLTKAEKDNTVIPSSLQASYLGQLVEGTVRHSRVGETYLTRRCRTLTPLNWRRRSSPPESGTEQKGPHAETQRAFSHSAHRFARLHSSRARDPHAGQTIAWSVDRLLP